MLPSFDIRHFPLNDARIPWGSTLAEAEARLPEHFTREPHPGWPDLTGACASVLGLAATTCNLRAPGDFKPIMQVSYELAAPVAAGWAAAVPEPWLSVLVARLGQPAEAEFTDSRWQRGASSVVYAARWNRPTLRISLSVYGSVRHEEGGPVAAGLFLDWTDEIMAGRPFYEAAQAQSAALQTVAEGAAAPKLFRTQLAQQAYIMADYAAADPYPGRSDAVLRQSQRALYRDGLLETPGSICTQLTDHQIALWAVPGRAEWAVSTRWDTVLLNAAGPATQLVTLRPAKGGGGLILSVGDWQVSDAYGAPGLSALAAAIEAQTGLTMSRVEDYDC